MTYKIAKLKYSIQNKKLSIILNIKNHTTLLEVVSLTNINCSSDCVYQKDGKCCFENISKQQVTPNNNCAYYLSKLKATTNK